MGSDGKERAMVYDTTEAVAKFLSGFQMKITNRERDTVAPDYYVKYSLTLSKGGKDFSTTFVSDPRASGEPTVTQVFSALADDALTLRKYSTDEFVDKLYAQGVKPSAALRAYDSLKETNLWMQDELYLSGWEIEEISKTLTKYEDEVNTLVEKAASERAARYAYDHPKLPKGFVTITQLQKLPSIRSVSYTHLLLIAGNARVPIRGKFPSGNVLYDLFSTNPNETKKTGLGDKKDAKPVI